MRHEERDRNARGKQRDKRADLKHTATDRRLLEFRWFTSPKHRCDEPVSLARYGCDEARVIGGVAQRLPDLLDGGVESLIEFHKGIGGPELALQFLTGDQLARPSQQNSQDLKGLFLEFDLAALPA